MSTCNFSKVNADNYYVIYSTYKDEDIDGNEVEYQRDEWDYDCLMECINDYANNTYGGYDRVDGYDGNRNYPASKVCEKDTEWETFGTKKPWFLEVGVVSTILMRSGYYSGGNLDYDITLIDCQGRNTIKLSEYYDLGDMIDDMLDTLEEIVGDCGHDCEHPWNLGTFKMQRKNIEKWLTDRILNMIEECEDICQKMCDETYVCGGVFSNGEAIYYKADTLKGKVCNIER